MPPRKEPKEAIIYPASKRKPPPFKPLRPSKVPRVPATSSESSSAKAQPKPKKTTSRAARRQTLPDSDLEADEDDREEHIRAAQTSESSDDNDDDDRPQRKASTASRFSTANGKPVTSRPFAPPQPSSSKRNSAREPSPMSLASRSSSAAPPPLPGDCFSFTLSSPSSPHLPSRAADTAAASAPAPDPLRADTIPAVPQPLLVRLLHEHFRDKAVRIDQHAIQVVQKYVEVFVREAIARTALAKRDEAASGAVSALDGKWLELEDLEKVAPGMMMDF